MLRIQKLEQAEGMFFIDNVTDIYYLTGKKVSEGVLLIFPEKAVFFVDSRYIDSCKAMKGLEVCLKEKTTLDDYIKRESPSSIYVDGKHLCFDRYQYLQGLLPEALITSSSKIEEVRSIKDPLEIQKMRVSGHLNYDGYEHAVSILKEGITEKEVAWEYEKFCRNRGGERLSFDPIIGFGANSAFPHHRSGDTKLKKGMAVLIDCGITVDMYTSDMTRTLFFDQNANVKDYREWKHHYDLVKESYDRALSKAKVGVQFSILDDQVQAYAKEQGVSAHVKHSLGHSLGLDVHEWPRVSYMVKNIPIRENMFFTIEPGLYFEGKWGIRYEDTILMTTSGPEIISKKSS